jgi:hypothetical protein
MNTHPRFVLALSLVATCATALAADLTPLNVEPGAWQTTTRTTPQGVLIPPEMLAQMPPAQRARIAASMQARSGKTSTHVDKECITAQQLQHQELPFAGPEGEGCARTVIASTSTRQEFRLSCPGGHGEDGGTVTATVNAPRPTAVNSVADMTNVGGGKVHVEVDARWLGASCAGIQD